MTPSPQTQRGAVTLIGALFIVVVLSVMAVALLRMTGSSLLDTAIHSDAVEALFIAETGIEHASFRYARTGSCATLAGIESVKMGRGGFSLIQASLQPNHACRIRIVARAGSTADNPAVRTIDAELRLDTDNNGANSPTLTRWEEVIGN